MSRPLAITQRVHRHRGRLEQMAWPDDVERLAAALASRRGCVWLDSAGGPARLARWSVLAAEPAAVLEHAGGRTRILSPDGRTLAESGGNPFDAVRHALARATDGQEIDLPAVPFGPGLYGYFGYDLAPYIEPKATLPPRTDIGLPDLWFGLYESVLVLDHERHEAFLIGTECPGREALLGALGGSAGAGARAPARRASATGAASGAAAGRGAGACVAPPAFNMSRDEFLEAVRSALRYIAAGDIFQVNLSRRVTVPLAGGAASALDLYLRLRRSNPAPYAAYLDLGAGRAVLSSSPELFLSLQEGRAVTRPIKGTRPLRQGDPAFNRQMVDDLLASEKDLAELVMIVDLERNDLGRVCSYGSVRVTEPRTVETLAAVHHTVATVEGVLHPSRDVTDLVKATFPGGSITGAPKVRAMQIIGQLEPTRRSVYTGAIGYLGGPTVREPAGRCVLNIAIRTLLVASGLVHAQVGGGIVADSRPEDEFDETNHKARAMLAAMGLVV